MLPTENRQAGTLNCGLLLKQTGYRAQASAGRTVRLCNHNGLTRIGQLSKLRLERHRAEKGSADLVRQALTAA
jgi:hypothetical protein